ncbi:MAG: ImmA/IrrE family metallo-endopeptidase [Eubacteriales bacterium]|jgi:hypothetical protein
MRKAIPLKPRRELVRKEARRCLLQSGQCRLPIAIDELFAQYSFLLLTAQEAEAKTGLKLPSSFWENSTADGFTCAYGGFFITLYKTEDRTPQRIRFTKAHELGHILLGHLTEFPQPSSFSLQESPDYHVLEREADLFAAELLAPTPLLRAMDAFAPADIIALCDLSQAAADITVSDIHRDLDVGEGEKHALLLRFHPWLFTGQYLTRLQRKVCPRCHAALEGSERFCMVCGEPLTHWETASPIPYDAPLLTRNGRLLYCPTCGNTQFRGGQTHCPSCGQALYNQCPQPEHHPLLPGNARYCPQCGQLGTYFQSGLLLPWEEANRQRQQQNLYFQRTIEGLPLSPQWHYWVHTILWKDRLSLYLALRDAPAIVDGDDLVIFTHCPSLPVEYIRTSLLQYCGLALTSITTESGGFTYDVP